MKAVSPLLQQVINISSIVGGVGTLIFCIWAIRQECYSPRKPYRPLSSKLGFGATTLYLFTDPTNRRSDHSGAFDLSGWGLYLRPHHRNHL